MREAATWEGTAAVLYGLLCFLPHVCHLFPVYVHRAAPACRVASPTVLCVLCALCALACCSFEPVEAVTRRWVQLYSLCVSGGVSK